MRGKMCSSKDEWHHLIMWMTHDVTVTARLRGFFPSLSWQNRDKEMGRRRKLSGRNNVQPSGAAAVLSRAPTATKAE